MWYDSHWVFTGHWHNNRKFRSFCSLDCDASEQRICAIRSTIQAIVVIHPARCNLSEPSNSDIDSFWLQLPISTNHIPFMTTPNAAAVSTNNIAKYTICTMLYTHAAPGEISIYLHSNWNWARSASFAHNSETGSAAPATPFSMHAMQRRCCRRFLARTHTHTRRCSVVICGQDLPAALLICRVRLSADRTISACFLCVGWVEIPGHGHASAANATENAIGMGALTHRRVARLRKLMLPDQPNMTRTDCGMVWVGCGSGWGKNNNFPCRSLLQSLDVDRTNRVPFVKRSDSCKRDDGGDCTGGACALWPFCVRGQRM